MPARLFHLCVCIIFFCLGANAQNPFNADFESINRATGTPDGIRSTHPVTFPLTIDSLIKQHGKYSAVLEQKDTE